MEFYQVQIQGVEFVEKTIKRGLIRQRAAQHRNRSALDHIVTKLEAVEPRGMIFVQVA